MISLSRYEQETIINFNEEESTAQVYTFNRSLQSKLRKLSEERPEECRLDSEERNPDNGSAAFIVPKCWIKVSPPRTVTRSEEQIEAMRERMRAMRAAQLSKE